MDAALAIVVALLVAGVVLFLVLRKRPPELPPSQARSETAAQRLPAPSAGGALAPGTQAQPAPAPDAAAQPEAPRDAPTAEATPPAATAADAAQNAREQDVIAIRAGLASTRGGFVARLAKLFGG